MDSSEEILGIPRKFLDLSDVVPIWNFVVHEWDFEFRGLIRCQRKC